MQPATFHPRRASRRDTISGDRLHQDPVLREGDRCAVPRRARRSAQERRRKLIVDVRGNAGGSVDEAIAAADDLLTSGLITSLEGRKIEPKRWQADRDDLVRRRGPGAGRHRRPPSGAEIFAAAIRGNNRGKLVGITTYGKAIVQRFIALPSGGGVQMTVAHYTTPDLKPITDTGVRPDVIVDLSSQAIEDPESRASADGEEDLILQKALQLFGAQAPAEKKAA